MSSTSSSSSSPPCRLLALPAELRNRIYRDALVSSNDVDITPTSLVQPSLLQTCHQIRAEASSIYYLGNNFNFFVGDFDHTIISAFRKQTTDSVFKEMGVSVCLALGASSWTNLLAWLKDWYHVGGIGMGRPDDGGGPKLNLAAVDAFQIATEMKFKLEWEDIETLLLIHKRSTETQAGGDWKWT